MNNIEAPHHRLRVGGIHQWPEDFPEKGQEMQKLFHVFMLSTTALISEEMQNCYSITYEQSKIIS